MSENETKAAKVQCAIDHKAPPAESLSKAHVISRLNLNSDPNSLKRWDLQRKEFQGTSIKLADIRDFLNQQIYHISMFIYLKQMLVKRYEVEALLAADVTSCPSLWFPSFLALRLLNTILISSQQAIFCQYESAGSIWTNCPLSRPRWNEPHRSIGRAKTTRKLPYGTGWNSPDTLEASQSSVQTVPDHFQFIF